MAKYQLRDPVDAIQFDGNNANAAFAYIKGDSFASMYADGTHLKVTNLDARGSQIQVDVGQWVVGLASGFAVLDDVAFQEQFVAVALD